MCRYSLHWWIITESREELLERCNQKGIDCTNITKVKSDKRACEILAERLIIHQALGSNALLCHTEEGAPYIKDNPIHISITHSQNIVCIALSQYCPLGIDIELGIDKILRVRDKFLNNGEQEHIADNDSAKSRLAWCAKEAIYKAASVKGIDFKEDITLNDDISSGIFRHNGTATVYNLYHTCIEDKYLATIATQE